MFVLLAASEDIGGLYPQGAQTLANSNPRRDSGVDLVCPADCEVAGGETAVLDLGVRAAYLSPEPSAFFLLARSSLTKTPLMLANGVGLIDLGYRGPIKAAVWNRSGSPFRVAKGQALFQLAAAGLPPAEFEVLGPSDPRAALLFGEGASLRGGEGFGSTGTGGSAAPAPPEAAAGPPADGAV